MNKHRTWTGLAAGIASAVLLSQGALVAAQGQAATQKNPGDSQAEHAHGKRWHKHHGPRNPEHLLKRFDQNQDGKLSLTEMPERMREHFAGADQNSDGVLSSDELRAQFEKRRAERFAQADKDGDGKLSADERSARFAEHRAQRFAQADKNADGALAESEVNPRFWSHIQKADADGNGLVTRGELDAAWKSGAMRGHHGADGQDCKMHKTPDAQ